MAVIIIPRRHITQPQGRVTVDWSSQLANGLAGAWVFNGDGGLIDCVTGQAAINRGCEVGVASPVGCGIRPVTAGIQVPWDMGISTQDLAVTVVEYRTTIPSGYWMIVDNRAAGVGYIYGNNNTIFNPSGVITTPGYSVKTFCKSEFWQEGIRTAAAIGTGLVPKKDIRFFGRYTDSDPYSNTVISALIVHRRNVADAEARELYSNPWQLFRADPIRIYSFPSGPIIPTLSGLTTSNITSSGARHSLTLTF